MQCMVSHLIQLSTKSNFLEIKKKQQSNHQIIKVFSPNIQVCF